MKNIESVVKDGLCTGCGTCAGICPNNAVEMHVTSGLLQPRVDSSKCNGCGLCLKCCPGWEVDFEALNQTFFGHQPNDALLGNFLDCYVGHSNDYDVRFNAASGGIVSQLLIYALEKGIIDGAVVTKMRRDKPLLPESFIAKSRDEIVLASKSKYCPTSPNTVLKEVLKEDGRFAFVGLPCQIHSLRKAEMNIKGLKEKIILHIGLFCSHTVNFNGTYFLLRKLGVTPGRVREIAYRGMGWPGCMFIRLKGDEVLTLQYVGSWNAYWPPFSSFFFTPLRCLMCMDETNEFSDVSVGDAWLKELKTERIGKSIIVVRTEKGREILDLASSTGVLTLKPINPSKVKRSQAEPLKFKKMELEARLALIRKSWRKVPNFKVNTFRSSNSPLTYARNLFALFNAEACERGFLKTLLTYIPLPLFRLYYGLYKFSCYL